MDRRARGGLPDTLYVLHHVISCGTEEHTKPTQYYRAKCHQLTSQLFRGTDERYKGIQSLGVYGNMRTHTHENISETPVAVYRVYPSVRINVSKLAYYV